MEVYQSDLELCVTILSNGLSVKDFLEKLLDTQESCRKIGNALKRDALCKSVYSLIQRMSDREENEMIHSIFWIYHGSEKGLKEMMEEKILTKEERQVLQEYKFPSYQYRNYEKFPLEEWNDIFTNFVFLQVLQVNQQNIKHMKMNRYKSKELSVGKVSGESQLIEWIDRVMKENCKKGENVFVYGVSNTITTKVKEMKGVTCKNENLTKEEVWEWKRDEEMKGHLTLLQERLKEMSDERKVDLFVFGRIKIEIKEHIEGYMLKELFIEERKIKILEGIVSKEMLNFKIIPIRSLERGDIGEEFIEKYHGLMGIKYY